MLEYEWGNPSQIGLLSESDQSVHHESEQARPDILDNYQHALPGNHHHFHSSTDFSHHSQQNDTHFSPLYSPPPFAPHYHHPQNPCFLPLEPVHGPGSFLMPKAEDAGRSGEFNARLGLNLGHRTYFSADDDFVNRLYRRSRMGSADPSGSTNSPRCQAEGCTADLSHAKHYHRRHKVCEFHSKASTVMASGLTQRFCQQCSRFHLLSEFDDGKRSCRKRLADHNRRRRKSHHQANQEARKPQQLETGRNSSSENLSKSPSDSGTQSSSSVTVAMSPPRMSLDYFRQRFPADSSASSSALFFSND